jgi:hypothetical protein
VLQVSGECRHPGDIQQAKESKFPSKLGTLEKRQDGYTSLYRRDAVYSGFGFDEFTNDTVGIQVRLIQILGKFRKQAGVWDFLLENGAQLVETLIDEQETGLRNLQQQLQAMKRRLLTDINKLLKPNKVTFNTNDKTERLVVVLPTQKIVLERRAKAFQIADQGGVLPSQNLRKSDWQSQSLKLHLSSSDSKSASGHANHGAVPSDKRKRRIIDDSDSDGNGDDDSGSKKVQKISVKKTKTTTTDKAPLDPPKAPGPAAGLTVKVEASKQKTETEESVVAIKTQLGVNAGELASSREALESEQSLSGKAISREIEQQEATIQKGERKVQRLKMIVQRVKSRVRVDENEVWDARECLREAYMTLGNDLLWFPTAENVDTSVAEARYEQALRCFGHAKDLVLEQKNSHQALKEGTNDDALDGRFVERNLVLLCGQATVNRGIALVEQSRLRDTKLAMRQKLLTQAMMELNEAEKCAKELRRLSQSHQMQACKISDRVEIFKDKLKADELESLTLRWRATGQWQLNQRESKEVFSRAAGFFFGTVPDEIIIDNFSLVFKLLEIGVGCIQSNNLLADLSCVAVEHLVNTRQQQSKISICEEHIQSVRKALEQNSQISNNIMSLASKSSFGQSIRSFMEEQDILSSEQYDQSKNEIVSWWQDVKDRLTTVERSAGKPEDLPRNDLMSRGVPMPRLASGQRFTIHDGISRRQLRMGLNASASRQNRGKAPSLSGRTGHDGPDDSFDAVFALADNDDDVTNQAATKKKKPLVFRKWGDELLPQEIVNPETGETRPKLVYPAIAPEMPAEIKAFLGITTAP